MASIGSMNKPTNGLLVGAVQMPVPIVNSRKDIDKQLKELTRMVFAMKGAYPDPYGIHNFKGLDYRTGQ